MKQTHLLLPGLSSWEVVTQQFTPNDIEYSRVVIRQPDSGCLREISVRHEDLPIPFHIPDEDVVALDALFVGVYPGGIVYSDRFKEQDHDYMKIAFLPYDTLELREDHPENPLMDRVRRLAEEMQMKAGTRFPLSADGVHSVVLGGER